MLDHGDPRIREFRKARCELEEETVVEVDDCEKEKQGNSQHVLSSRTRNVNEQMQCCREEKQGDENGRERGKQSEMMRILNFYILYTHTHTLNFNNQNSFRLTRQLLFSQTKKKERQCAFDLGLVRLGVRTLKEQVVSSFSCWD